MTRLAITLTQPWASLVASGAKRVETRSWRTSHRGWLGIHAAKGWPSSARKLCSESPFIGALYRAGYREWVELPRGALLGYVELLDCVPTTGLEVVGISEEERAFGDYGADRWAWLLGDFKPLAEPLPMKGALSIWRIP